MSTDFPTNIPSKPRACKLCSSISSLSKFKSRGCLNCKTISKDSDFSSNEFKGMIGLVDPSNSWVAKWQRINKCQSGLYAMVVKGEVDEDVIIDYEKSGEIYIDRNESFKLL